MNNLNYMKPFLILLVFLLTVIITSCSSDDGGEEMIKPTPQETFGNWSPDFTNQTSNFIQTRIGSNGTSETRTINVTASSSTSSSTEEILNDDVNDDGDLFDEIIIRITSYSADNNLGSHEITEYEILNDINNYFKIGEYRFSIGRVASDYYSNSITCNGVPAYYNHDLTFYSETENEQIYIEFFNNNSDQFKPGEYLSFFNYLNPFFNNQFNDWEQMNEYIDNLSNQDLYDIYLSNLCSDSEYRLMSIVEVEFQGYHYEVDLEDNFNINIDLDNETYTASMTGYIRQGSDNLASEKVELLYKACTLGIRTINIGSYASDWVYHPAKPNFKYAIEKKALRDTNSQLFDHGYDVTCINFGYFDTERVAHIEDPKMDLDYIIEVLFWVLNQPHRVKELTVVPRG